MNIHVSPMVIYGVGFCIFSVFTSLFLFFGARWALKDADCHLSVADLSEKIVKFQSVSVVVPKNVDSKIRKLQYFYRILFFFTILIWIFGFLGSLFKIKILGF